MPLVYFVDVRMNSTVCLFQLKVLHFMRFTVKVDFSHSDTAVLCHASCLHPAGVIGDTVMWLINILNDNVIYGVETVDCAFTATPFSAVISIK